MKLRWLPAAADDLTEIYEYLQEHMPYYAVSTVDELHAALRSLKQLPYRGKQGRISGTREFVLPRLPYIIVYRVKELTIEVVRIHHGARDRTIQ